MIIILKLILHLKVIQILKIIIECSEDINSELINNKKNSSKVNLKKINLNLITLIF